MEKKRKKTTMDNMIVIIFITTFFSLIPFLTSKEYIMIKKIMLEVRNPRIFIKKTHATIRIIEIIIDFTS